MTTRRKIVVGADGKADVLLLTDPIPRHLSLVSWGANDRPAESWKSAEPPQQVLRTFPAEAIDVRTLNLQRVQSFVSETLDALSASVADVLRNPLRAADRAAQVQALHSQAGARIAAFSVAVAPMLKSVTKTYRTAGLTLPDPPTTSTLQGELDRRQFMAGMEQAGGALTDQLLSIMRDDGGVTSATESILSLFGQTGAMFATWAQNMPDGVVGVSAPEATQNATGMTDIERSAPDVTENVGSRNSKGDQAKLNQIMRLLKELGATIPTSTENLAMNITIADLQKLAEENPVGLMTAIKTALEKTQNQAPEIAKKFMWGETGVEQHSPQQILAALGDMQSGAGLAGLIASALAGVDVGTMAERDNVQVSATMRKGIVSHVVESIKAEPKGELAEAVKEALAPDIAEAVAESMKAVLRGMQAPETTQNSGPFGLGGFTPDEDAADPLKPVYPSAGRFNR